MELERGLTMKSCDLGDADGKSCRTMADPLTNPRQNRRLRQTSVVGVAADALGKDTRGDYPAWSEI